MQPPNQAGEGRCNSARGAPQVDAMQLFLLAAQARAIDHSRAAAQVPVPPAGLVFSQRLERLRLRGQRHRWPHRRTRQSHRHSVPKKAAYWGIPSLTSRHPNHVDSWPPKGFAVDAAKGAGAKYRLRKVHTHQEQWPLRS